MFKSLSNNQITRFFEFLSKVKKAIIIISVVTFIVGSLPFQSKISANTIDTEIVEYKEDINSPPVLSDMPSRESVLIVEEDISKREDYVKHYLKEDGSYEAVIYGNRVHFYDGESYQDIDNTLIEKDGKILNKANDFKISFPKELEKEGINLSYRDTNISFSISGVESGVATFNNLLSKTTDIRSVNSNINTVSYESEKGTSNLQYQIHNDSLEMNLLLDRVENGIVRLNYQLNGLELVDSKEGLLIKSEDKIIYRLSLLLKDNSGNLIETPKYTVIKDEDTYCIDLQFDERDNINANAPALLNQIMAIGEDAAIEDTFISSFYDNYNYNSFDKMYISNSNGDEQRALINYKTPNYINNNIINYAYLALVESPSSTSELQLNVYKNNSVFNANGTDWGNAPGYDLNRIIDYRYQSVDGIQVFNITPAVKEWHDSGAYSNGSKVPGFTIATEWSPNYKIKSFFQTGYTAELNPKIIIGYESPEGIKEHWSYTSQNLGITGSGYVSDYTGNLTWVREDFSHRSLVLSFIHSNHSKNENVGYGKGWKSNYDITIEDESYTKKTVLFPDGRKLHFVETEITGNYGVTIQIFKTDNPQYELKIYSGAYVNKSTLTLPNKLVYEFNETKSLTKIIGSNNINQLIIERDTLNQISNIIDIFGNKIQLEYSNNLLVKSNLIINDGGIDRVLEEKEYVYDNYRLVELNNKFKYTNQENYESTIVKYTYDTLNNLKSAYCLTNEYKVTYDYLGSKVSKIELTDDQNKLGTYNINYAYGKTTYQDQYGKKVHYYFDHYGHTVNVLDDDGNIIGRNYQGNHQLTDAFQINLNSVNHIQNHGFEYTNGWVRSSYVDYSNESLFGEGSLLIKASSNGLAEQKVRLKRGNYSVEGFIKNLGIGDAYIEILGASSVGANNPVKNASWTKYSRTFTLSYENEITIRLRSVSNQDVYFDNIQLGSGFVNQTYNMLENGSFESSTSGWSMDNDYLTATYGAPSILGNYAIQIVNSIEEPTAIMQSINIRGYEKSISVSGFAKARAPMNPEGYFGMIVSLINVNSSLNEDIFIPFNPALEDWQFAQKTIPLKENTIQAVLTVLYQGAGEAYFDGFSVTNGIMSNSYEYNENHQIASISNAFGKTYLTYDSRGRLIGEVTEGSNSNEKTYNYNNQNQLLYNEIRSSTLNEDYFNVREVFTYDSKGNLIEQKTEGMKASGLNYKWFSTKMNYTSDFQYLAESIDEFGNKTEITTNTQTGLVDIVLDPFGLMTSYQYNEFGQVIQIKEEKGTLSSTNQIEYDLNGRISKIIKNNLEYSYTYNDLDQITSVKVGLSTYLSNTYVTKTTSAGVYYTDLIQSQSYGNGTVVSFLYNSRDQLSSIKVNNITYYEYEYNNNGSLAVYKDISNNMIYYYSYDAYGRVVQIADQSLNKINMNYDHLGNICELSYNIGGTSRTVEYIFNPISGEYDYTTYQLTGGQVNINYDYQTDSLRRLTEIELIYNQLSITKKLTYDEVGIVNGNTSMRLKSERITVKYITSKSDEIHTYTYDSRYNIIAVHITNSSGVLIKQVNYHYDTFNQLIREDIYYPLDNTQSRSITYNYDINHNRLTTKEYGYLYPGQPETGTPKKESRMSYNDLNELISISNYQNGSFIGTKSYIFYSGNLTESNENFGGYIYRVYYIWEGTQLKEIYENSSYPQYLYHYNDEGIRVSKQVYGTTYNYTVLGNKVLKETWDNSYILYTYDVDGSLISFNYNGIEYFYVKNTQNDILKITDSSGNILVTYDYDSFGNTIKVTDTSEIGLSSKNPYRYRSYRYDAETGYYYLNQRYYDPKVGRFISQDNIGFSDPSDSKGLNLYSYCLNNPVMYIDGDGTFPEWVADFGRFVGGYVITVAGVIATVATAPLLLIPGAASTPLFTANMTTYGAMLMASPFSSTIKSDMQLIGWNPFSSNETAVLASQNVSFYKGVLVIRYGDAVTTRGGGFSFGIIGIGRGETRLSTVSHEYGHHKQQRLMGLTLYTPIVAIPSLISASRNTGIVHSNKWYERWATDWGNRGWIWW